MNTFMQIHTGLHTNLDYLINYQYHQNNQGCQTALRKHILHSSFSLKN